MSTPNLVYRPTSTSITIDSMTTKSNLKSTKSMSKGKAKDTTIHTTSTLTQPLDFISTHLIGRQEVRKQRALISCTYLVQSPNFLSNWEEWHRILEEYPTRPSKLKAPTNYNKHSAEDIPTLLNKQRKDLTPVHDGPSTRYRGNGMWIMKICKILVRLYAFLWVPSLKRDCRYQTSCKKKTRNRKSSESVIFIKLIGKARRREDETNEWFEVFNGWSKVREAFAEEICAVYICNLGM